MFQFDEYNLLLRSSQSYCFCQWCNKVKYVTLNDPNEKSMLHLT